MVRRLPSCCSIDLHAPSALVTVPHNRAARQRKRKQAPATLPEETTRAELRMVSCQSGFPASGSALSLF